MAFQLSRYFSALSFVGIVIVVFALSYYYQQLALNSLTTHETRANVALTKSFANSIGSKYTAFINSASKLSKDELINRQEIKYIHQEITQQMKGLNVIKVKIYNMDGLTVFSTDQSQIGADKSDNVGFLTAKSGEVASELTFRNEIYGFEKIVVDRNLLSSYIPIYNHDNSKIVSVFELYSDVTELVEAMEKTQWLVSIGVFIALTCLYIFLFFVVRRADNIIKAQHEEQIISGNILRSMAGALIVSDADHRIKTVNDSTLAMLGYKQHELISQPIGHIFDDNSSLDKLTEMLSKQDKVSEFETEFTAINASAIPVQLSATRMHDANNNTMYTILVAENISERVKFTRMLAREKEKLECINKELDQFAYVVSHDLKAPLRAIANLSTWIEEDLEEALENDTRQQMDLLRKRVSRMESLINGILEYSRIGRVATNVSTVDVGNMLAEIESSLSTPNSCNINIKSQMPTIVTAYVPLFQVFSNLLSNAVKHSNNDDSQIDISVKDAGEFYEFTVSDDGPGIAPQFHNKIFAIFQTLEARDKVESTGVGLSIVKKIIESQGGTISIESSEGQGATFRFTWPINIEEEEAA